MRLRRDDRFQKFRLGSLTCALLATIVLYQARGAAAQVDMDESPTTIGVKIRKGDPNVVPILRGWLAEASDTDAVREETQKLALALRGLGLYRDTASVELISFFYNEAPFQSSLRKTAARAIATIGAKESLADLKRIVWDQGQSLATRCSAAAALVELDEELGREFLLLQYDLYRLERKTVNGSNMDPVRDTLEQLSDPQLVQALERRLPNETGKMLNNIKTLLTTMAINAESIENLKSVAANTSWTEGKYRRYAAIQALGHRGGPDLVPFLKSLRPWEEIDPDPNHIQQRFIREFADKAIIAIRQRHWKHYMTVEEGTEGDAENRVPKLRR